MVRRLIFRDVVKHSGTNPPQILLTSKLAQTERSKVPAVFQMTLVTFSSIILKRTKTKQWPRTRADLPRRETAPPQLLTCASGEVTGRPGISSDVAAQGGGSARAQGLHKRAQPPPGLRCLWPSPSHTAICLLFKTAFVPVIYVRLMWGSQRCGSAP